MAVTKPTIMKRAVFLDKDGTIITDLPYNVNPARISFLPGAWKGLSMLHRSGYKLVIITNQSGVARGYFTEDDLDRLAVFFASAFRRRGITLSGFYYCPHLPGGAVDEYNLICGCRKPQPGLIHKAQRELNIDLKASWYIGNIATDIEAGRAAGCRTVLIEQTSMQAPAPPPGIRPHYMAADLAEAAAYITNPVTAGMR